MTFGARGGFPIDVRTRNNVTISGRHDGQPMLFAHGFGCDQHMWRFVAPVFEDRFRIVLFDHVGAGGSDVTAYAPDRYTTIADYARDILEISRELDLDRMIFVGHSVSAMMGVVAAAHEPARFDKLVLVGPSPRYIDDDGYVGGFTREDIDGLLESLDSNYLGWSRQMAPVIMGNPDRPDLRDELTNSFCRADPEIQRNFARVTFLGDNRSDRERATIPALVLQCSEDAIAPPSVGAYVADRLPNAELVVMRATGHCPNLSAPQETIDAIEAFLSSA